MLRLYPDPQSTRLREALAEHHGVAPEQVFVGNGSDEVLAHAFAALLKQPKPVLFPGVTYSFYPVYCRLWGIDHEAVPLDAEMRVRIADYLGRGGSIIIANPNAPTGIALSRAEIERLVEPTRRWARSSRLRAISSWRSTTPPISAPRRTFTAKASASCRAAK